MKIIESSKGGLLVFLASVAGLSYQVGFWSEFNINLFSYATPSDLIASTVTPLLTKTFVLIPFFIALGCILLSVSAGIDFYNFRRAIKRKKHIRKAFFKKYFLYACLGIFCLASSSYLSAPEGVSYKNDGIAVSNIDSFMPSNFSGALVELLIGTLYPLLSLIAIYICLYYEARRAKTKWLSVGSLNSLLGIFAVVTMYSIGRAEGLENKFPEWGGIRIMGGPFTIFNYQYGYGSCLANGSLYEILLKENILGNNSIIRFLGRLSDKDFFFVPEKGILISIGTKKSEILSLTSCFNVSASYLNSKPERSDHNNSMQPTGDLTR